MQSLKKIFMFLYVTALLPVIALTCLEFFLDNVPFWVYIIAVAIAALLPFIVLVIMRDKKDDFASQFMDKLTSWDFTQNDEEEDDPTVLSLFYKEIKEYFTKLFSSMHDITTLSDNLMSSIDGVAENAASISQISDGIAKGAISQAEEVETCAQLSDEIGKKTEEMTLMSNKLIEETRQLSTICETGNGNIASLKEDNTSLYTAINGIVEQVNNLVGMASNITKITEIMYGISDQTSLLALNASIEAARAGEVGRSFAVVAEEIRKLSTDSRDSSASINDMITSITTSLTEIKRTLDQSQAIFQNQNNSVAEAAASFDNINDFIGDFVDKQSEFGDSFEVFKKSQDVLITSIETIASVSQESAATTEELASLVMSQHNSMDALKDLTGSLKGNTDKVKAYSQNIKVTKSEAKRKKYAIITDSTNEFWDPLKKTAAQTAKIYNVDVEVFEAGDRKHCVENQLKFLEKIVADKFDGVAISPVNDPKIVQAIKGLEQHHIQLLFINSELKGCKSLGLYETNGINAGKSAAEVVAKLLHNKGTAIYGKWKDVHIESIEQRGEGFREGLSNYPGITMHTAHIPANPTLEEAETIIHQLLREHPETSVFFATNVDWALHYLRYKKKHNSDYKIVTIDFVKSLSNEVRNGVISSCISQRPFVWGEMAIKALVDATEGKQVNKYMDTGTFEINGHNIDVFMNRFS